MTAPDQPGNDQGEQSSFERWGCVLLILATLLFAVERYLIFGVVQQWSAQGNRAAEQLVDLLFGEAPFSVFDVLLGFEFPDEGLLFLLQPRNLAVGAIQAVHFGLNLGLVTLPFWLLKELRQVVAVRKATEQGAQAPRKSSLIPGSPRAWAIFVAGIVCALVCVGAICLVPTLGQASVKRQLEMDIGDN